MQGVYSLNESVAITRSRDKLRAHQLLARKGIGMPVTGFAHAPDDTSDLIGLVGGAPVVVKLTEGTQLIVPNNTFLSAQTYNEMFTMHATTMIFLAVMPLSSAFSLAHSIASSTTSTPTTSCTWGASASVIEPRPQYRS